MLVKKQLYVTGYTRSRRDYSACTGPGSILLRFTSLRGIPIASQLSTADYRTAVRLGRRRSRETISNLFSALVSSTLSLFSTLTTQEKQALIGLSSFWRSLLEETLASALKS